MADHQPSGPDRHLDAAGPREVVYCHECENEWYQDEYGLVCPRCEGEVTEIVSYILPHLQWPMLTSQQITPESDPRPGRNAPRTPPELRDLHNHNPWGADSDVSDPEEADIEEHITHGPGGSIFISQTIRSHGRPRPGRRGRNPAEGQGDPIDVMRDFQSMLGNLMGPGFRPGPPGRSGHEDLFPPPPMGFRLGGNGLAGGAGPGVIGGRFTYTTGRLHPRNANEPQAPPDLATYASPSSRSRPPHGRSLYVVSITAPPDQLASLIGNILGGLQGPPGVAGDQEARGGMPPGLQGLFASLLNPANARAGDAVYSQEALDQIISTLMEQHPTSNAPGPASPDAIAALPKKKLDEKLLGPEGKGECSVCMDDVHIGDEVVMLPCSHWFHEACAGAWLGEHNTCPICRKGIEGDAPSAAPPPNNRRSSQTGQPAWARPERLSRRMSLGSRLSRENTGSRNEARLDSIRNAGRLTPTEESGPRRWQLVGDSPGGMDYTRAMPGSFSSPRRRDSEMSIENQRDSRRGNTSGSDQSRDSRRSSASTSGGAGNNNNNGSSGPISWLRNRFSGEGSNSNNDRRQD